MKKNVLVFPCGSEIGLEIARSLLYSKHFKLFGASSIDDHGKFVYERYFGNVANVDETRFISEINKICDDNNIDYIFPAHDSVVIKLAQHRNKIRPVVVTSEYETCKIARSKKLTYEVLGKHIPVPKLFTDPDKIKEFPIFIKPDVGQGSKGTLVAYSSDEMKSALAINANLLVCEFLPGFEYTVDCFTGENGQLLYAKARKRNRINNGISVNSFFEEDVDSEFSAIAKEINKHIKLIGAWFFQVKRDVCGELKLLEIAPRIAGAMCLSRMSGVNLPLLTLYLTMGVKVKIPEQNQRLIVDRALSSSYDLNYDYKQVYLDFDDTLVIDSRVNPHVLSFIYRSKNHSKKIILLSRHSKGKKHLYQELKRLHINKDLFDSIILLPHNKRKSEYVNGASIFIDDSFQERLDVSQNTSAMVFDVSEIVELSKGMI